MIDVGKRNLLGVLIDAVDYDATVDRIIAGAHARAPLAVSALAVHGVMTGVLDPSHRYRLNHLDLVVPDGQPVRWALNLLHHAGLRDRVYGPNLMLRICQRAADEGLPIFLYGSRDEVLDRLGENLRRQFPGLTIAGREPSKFRRIGSEEKLQIVARVRESGARIVLVGLGCPRQEVWAFENREALSLPVIAVGAAFDFHAGLLRQAPGWMQRTGLEWAFRLIAEPRRLWRRYLFLNPYYLGLLLLQAIHPARFDPVTAIAPIDELGYG